MVELGEVRLIFYIIFLNWSLCLSVRFHERILEELIGMPPEVTSFFVDKMKWLSEYVYIYVIPSQALLKEGRRVQQFTWTSIWQILNHFHACLFGLGVGGEEKIHLEIIHWPVKYLWSQSMSKQREGVFFRSWNNFEGPFMALIKV